MRKVWLLALCLAALLALSGCAAAREVVCRKTAAMFTDSKLPEADVARMIGFAVDLSYCDFSGTREDIRDPEALALWERYLPDAVFTYYLKGALAEKPWNMNHYDFGTGAAAKYFHEIATNPCPVSSISLRPRNVY